MSKGNQSDKVRRVLAANPGLSVAETCRQTGASRAQVYRVRREMFPGKDNRSYTSTGNLRTRPSSHEKGPKSHSKRETKSHEKTYRQPVNLEAAPRPKPKAKAPAPVAAKGAPALRSAWLWLSLPVCALVSCFSVWQSAHAFSQSISMNAWGLIGLSLALSLAAAMLHGYGAAKRGLDLCDFFGIALTGLLYITGAMFFKANVHNAAAEQRGLAAKEEALMHGMAEIRAAAAARAKALQLQPGQDTAEWQQSLGARPDGKIGQQTTKAFQEAQAAIATQADQSMIALIEKRADAAQERGAAKTTALAVAGAAVGAGLIYFIQLIVTGLEMIIPRFIGPRTSPLALCTVVFLGCLAGAALFLKDQGMFSLPF